MATKLQAIYADLDEAQNSLECAKDDIDGATMEFDNRFEELNEIFKQLKEAQNSIMEITEETFKDVPKSSKVKTDFSFITLQWVHYLDAKKPSYEICVCHLMDVPISEEEFTGEDPTYIYKFEAKTIKELNEKYQMMARFYKGVK